MNTQIANDQELYDIYGHWHVPFWQTRFFAFALSALTVILILALIIFILKKYFKKRLTPTQQALHEIEILKKRTILTRQDAHDVYFKLTDILKSFFQSYYKQPFKHLTDQEMLEALNKTNFPVDLKESLENMVQSSASVKYAAGHDLQENVRKNVQSSELIVRQLNTIKKEK